MKNQPLPKTSDSDFLSNSQRLAFVFITLPIINIFSVIIVAFTSTRPWISVGLGALTPIFGAILLSFGNKKQSHFNNQLTIVVNGTVSLFFCAFSGPYAPSYLMGMANVGACSLLLNRLTEVILFIILGLAEIAVGSYLAGKSFTDIAIALVTLLCFAIAMVRFRQFTLKQGNEIIQASQEIQQQKELIEEKNRSITDSINYALRIQNAKLPEKQKIYSAFPQSFVLFKPKDIVSGDFYFFHQKNDVVYLAAADCTGHGVPGAMMSMIGMERLDDVLQQQDNPSDILQQLNRSMKLSLRQTGSDGSTRDGMDIALVGLTLNAQSLKHESNLEPGTLNVELKYAGANRPFWIIRKDTKTIEEIKATKKAIGGLTDELTKFDTHTIELQAGDCFYIFSDGFADTFGGKTNKKLTTKKFKELLLSIQNLDMKAQEKYLDDFIEEWKAGSEQVDDILVIGVRMQ